MMRECIAFGQFAQEMCEWVHSYIHIRVADQAYLMQILSADIPTRAA